VKIKIIFPIFAVIFLSSCLFNEDKPRIAVNRGLSPQAMFKEAEAQLDAGAVDEAINLFNDVQAAYPSSKYAIQAKLEIIYTLFKRSRHTEALLELDQYIDLYPSHLTTPYAYYLRGLIAEDKSKSILDNFFTDNSQRDVSSVVTALNNYLDLIKKYPESKYSEEAKEKLVILRNVLARHELFVAIFYTKKEAFIAAINRCKYIIEKFPNTPSVPAALHLIAHNYDKIDAPILAKDARRVLKASYPKYIPHYTLD